jgi:hypothetical protein
MAPRVRSAFCLLLAALLTIANAQIELSLLARSGTLADVQAALAAGADVSAVTADGDTALLVAVRYNTREIVEALLDAGADPHYENPRTGDTIFRLASKNPDSSSIYRIFIDRGIAARVSTPASPAPSSPTSNVAAEVGSSAASSVAGARRNPDLPSRNHAESRGFVYVNRSDGVERSSVIRWADRRLALEDHPLSADEYQLVCQELARNDLLAPATARFTRGLDVTVNERGVYGYLFEIDAQNAFGALIRRSATCFGIVESNILHLWVEVY